MTREEARRAMFFAKREVLADSYIDKAYDMAIKALEEPEPKTGRWIYGKHDVAMCDGYWCDKCGFFVPWDYQHKSIDFIKDYHICPSCGARMEVDHENDRR